MAFKRRKRSTCGLAPERLDDDHRSHGGSVGCGCSHDHVSSSRIAATVVGANLLITAAIAHYWLVWPVHADLTAMVAALLLGVPLVLDAVSGLRKGAAHMDTLVVLAVGASFATGQYLEAGSIAFFMLISSFIEHHAAEGARKSIESLIRLTPRQACMLTADGEVTIDARDLRPGNRVLVRPGDNIPGDGVVRQGSSTIDQSNITGESVPVERGVGEDVFGGTINHTGVLEVEITRAGKDTTLGQTQALILKATQNRPASVRLIEQYASWYTPTVLMLAGIVFLMSHDVDMAISLLLIGCPCAFILSAPTAMVAALSAAARLGVLIKNVADLEVAKNLTAVVFDKTGTLTLGELTVARLFPVEGVDPADLLLVCASAEQGSKHPVARAVQQTARRANLEMLPATGTEEVHGRGVRASLNGEPVLVGRESWLVEQGVEPGGIDLSSSAGMSLLFVARDGRMLGAVGLEDSVRPGARQALSKLADLGLQHLAMVTGDRRSPAERVARELKNIEVYAEALPAQKVEIVEDLKRRGHTVLVVGDGVNDGPALAAGHISVAMGAAGSDVAIHSASIALMNSNLNRIPFLVQLSRRTVSVVRQNLLGVLVYIAAMLALLAAGWVTPLVAAIAHGVSSMVVVLSSARLVRAGEDLQEGEVAAASTATAARARGMAAGVAGGTAAEPAPAPAGRMAATGAGNGKG